MAFIPEPLPKVPCSLPEAIGRVEGFYAHGAAPNRPQRNCNPGDIEYGNFAKSHGAIGNDGRFAIFPDANTGYACLTSLLKLHYASQTVEGMVNRYAPPNENNTSSYVQLVCEWTGLAPTDLVGDHI